MKVQTGQSTEKLDEQIQNEECLLSMELLAKQQEMDNDIGPVIKLLKNPEKSENIKILF